MPTNSFDPEFHSIPLTCLALSIDDPRPLHPMVDQGRTPHDSKGRRQGLRGRKPVGALFGKTAPGA